MLLKKKVILCADDFGISPSVSKSICALAEKKRISATSVMVVYEDWNILCQSLLEHKLYIDIGLHLVLTEARPLIPSKIIPSLTGESGDFFGMKQFMKRAWFGRIKSNEVYSELTAQYSKFVEYFGVEPDFIDGHHNVHQFPAVWNEIIRFVKNRGVENKIYIRNTAHRWTAALKKTDIFKTVLISIPGIMFKSRLLAGGLRTNESFGGVYSLTHSDNFEKRLKNFFILAGDKNAIIMTHPGQADSILAQRDPFCKGRELEEQVLLQEFFPKFLKEHNISLSKFEYM
tara:strand:- start:305 stop:1165 length:861 start_codon:yes stop_codon:yes gene_type:complete